MLEEEAKARAIQKELVKDGKYRVYVIDNEDNNKNHEYLAYYLTDYPIDNTFYRVESFEEFIKTIESSFYTEEEILAPCPSLAEFNRRVHFLLYTYPKQVNPMYNWKHNHTNNEIVNPFVEDMGFNSKNREFVNHYILLWKGLQKLRRPTIFPSISSDISNYLKADVYITLIPFADPDDFSLPDAEGYLRSNARNIAKIAYLNDRSDITLYLIEKGYIKKPTLQKLLDMANEKEDAQLAAIILDKLKDKKPKNPSSKFAL